MSKSSIEEQVEDIAKKQLAEIKYYTKTEVINSEIEKALKIGLNGDDWTFSQHKKINTVPTEEDFKNTIKEYLDWKVKFYY